MTKTGTTNKGNQPADSDNGIVTTPITPDNCTETELDILGLAWDECEQDGVRIAEYLGSLPADPPENAYTSEDAMRIIKHEPALLELVRQEIYPGDRMLYGLYRTTDAGKALYDAATDVFIQREHQDYERERAARKASARTLTHWQHLQELGQLSETEFSMTSAFIGAIASIRAGVSIHEQMDLIAYVQPTEGKQAS
jgi:hypothetical protein